MLYEKQKFYQSRWDCSYGDRIRSSILTDWVNERKWMRKLKKGNEALAKKDDENERSPNMGSFFLVWSKCQ